MPSGWKISRCDILVERHAAHARDDVAEQEEVDVAVDESLAGRGGRHFFARQLDRRVVALPRIAEIDVGPQSRDMRQQMADRDAALAVALESRNEARDRIVQPDAALLDRAASPRSSSRRPWSTTRGRRSCRASSAPASGRPRADRRPSRRAPASPRPTSTTAPGVCLAVDRLLDQLDRCRQIDLPGLPARWIEAAEPGRRRSAPRSATARQTSNAASRRCSICVDLTWRKPAGLPTRPTVIRY